MLKSISTPAPVVMVVEDEESVLDVARSLLEWQGYQVLAAKSGQEAIALEAVFAGEISLLLVDVVLQSGSGADVARHVRSRRPSVRVLFMSGYSPDFVLSQEDRLESDGFIAKPFTLKSIMEQVLQVSKCEQPVKPLPENPSSPLR